MISFFPISVILSMVSWKWTNHVSVVLMKILSCILTTTHTPTYQKRRYSLLWCTVLAYRPFSIFPLSMSSSVRENVHPDMTSKDSYILWLQTRCCIARKSRPHWNNWSFCDLRYRSTQLYSQVWLVEIKSWLFFQNFLSCNVCAFGFTNHLFPS